MIAHGNFGDDRRFELSRAILLYEEQRGGFDGSGERQTICAATIHDITVTDARASLEPGSPLTVDALESLVTSLGKSLDLEDALLPERMLSVGLTRMAWWCPAARRRIWFKPVDETDAAKALKKLNGSVVAHPPLLFVASGRHLRVLALAESKRPTAATKLFRAPYWNLDQSGLMCAGNVVLPPTAMPSLMVKFEQAFFNSAFSHSHWGHQLHRHPDGQAGLWRAMAAAKTFVRQLLVPTKQTLGDVLKSAGK